MENKDYSQLYLNGMRKAGYNEGENAKQKFISFFGECLEDEYYNEITNKFGLNHELFCAALAQLRTSKLLGCSNDGPYNIKAFWKLTDEQADFIIKNCPDNLGGFAQGAILRLNDKFK